MNHLGHLHLARAQPELMAGVFLGDFVKGILKGNRPVLIETGIRFHRAVDAYVDAHHLQRVATARLDPEFHRYGGIVCDVVFDHFLARHWPMFSDDTFETFCRSVYAHILHQEEHLEPRAATTIIRMQEYGSLENYQTETYIERSLNHIGSRLSRANPLDRAFEQYKDNAEALEADFLAFMPDVDAFAKDWLSANAEPQTR